MAYDRIPCPSKIQILVQVWKQLAIANLPRRVHVNASPDLRRALANQAKEYADAHVIPHCLSFGDSPVVCFSPYDGGVRHGNFIDRSYKAIRARPEWTRRLAKVHTLGKRSFPANERGRWMELDTCASSDALLMNIFCYPGALRDGKISALMGAESEATPEFGYKARVPLLNGRFDRTEVDMRLGNLLVEAKLTEDDFQNADKRVLLEYRDFSEVFDRKQLPYVGERYASYQLLRNVLAAHALQCSFCVLIDARRTDLAGDCYAVMKCVKPVELRTKLRVSTWQEVAGIAPPKLGKFLAAKYGFAINVR